MQTALNAHQVQTRDGSLCLYGKAGVLFADVGRPVLLMIHGALRHSGVLFDWLHLGEPEFDVVFVDLPGHGRSPPTTTVTIENFAANVGDAVTAALGNRAVVVVGESLGGLVALAMGGLHIGPIRGIIAADPPLTMAKLWHVRNAISSAITSDPANRFLQAFALNIFGVDSNGGVHERIYFPLIEQSQVPVLILTGDVPLFPARNVNAVPCLVDDVDRYVVSRFTGGIAQFKIVSGCGHLLLIDAKQKCRSMIGDFCVTVNKLPATVAACNPVR
jgi:pimeloyl-ACP methyl ester carboxylesterase